ARGAQGRGVEPRRVARLAVPVAGAGDRRDLRGRGGHLRRRPRHHRGDRDGAHLAAVVPDPRVGRPRGQRYLAGLPRPARAARRAERYVRMPMEIILREDVQALGKAGEVVKVKDGYARNYLLPKGLAYPATDANKKKITFEAERLGKQRAAEKQAAEGE